MSLGKCAVVLAAVVVSGIAVAVSRIAVAQAPQEVERPVGGIVDFLAPIHPDPLLQHAKEIYVLYGCAYCHGVDLTVRNGEAADLLHSKLVAVDVNGEVIGQLLHVGIPQTAKLSPMPQFGDVSDRDVADMTRWIHYSRQQEHYKELMKAGAMPAGDAAAGKTYFDKTCSGCHSEAQIKGMAKKYDAATLRTHALKPALLESTESFKVADLTNVKWADAKVKHGRLLENYTPAQVANLSAYLATLK